VYNRVQAALSLYSYTINGQGIFDHKDTLTEEQTAALKAALYAYHTLAAETDI
jgi:hypothetical protein